MSPDQTNDSSRGDETTGEYVTPPGRDADADLFALLRTEAERDGADASTLAVEDLAARWSDDCPITTERYLQEIPGLADDEAATLALVEAEFRARLRVGPPPTVAEFAERFPRIRDRVAERLGGPRADASTRADESFSLRIAPLDDGAEEAHPPELFLGRYRIVGMLGAGGFGRVYLAFDTTLNRRVAIKIPRADRVKRPEDATRFLDEARILASLDHPHIVPVHDAGRSDDGTFYIISKLVDGCNLSAAAARYRGKYAEAAALTACIAEAIQHAHDCGLVHRDVKPGNILVGGAGRPYLADFGLALRDSDFLRRGPGSGIAGTPAYMSPEQARGEGHRIDGRTDVFSLGIVFYELLAGRHPYRGASGRAILERIASDEPQAPRRHDADIPAELERICLRALALRLADRYRKAADFAEDLRQYARAAAAPAAAVVIAPPDATRPATSPAEGEVVRVVPKGLRSFEAGDAEFFLSLFPGPRDRRGLPETIRFWLGRIEADDPAEGFAVGLIYGPSGCGKSSMVKAGLLPRLRGTTAVFVEAGPDLEGRLLTRLRRALPDLDPGLDLPESLAAVRRDGVAGAGRVLLVIDQFEQWLHRCPVEDESPLVRGLRQCDGARLKALVLVRDDFWSASGRFMRALDVRVVEGENAAAVDLFTPPHARRVLAAFGTAYERLPGPPEVLRPEQERFLDLAVADLTRDEAVIPVRLALLAETLKGRDWTDRTLEKLGDLVGIGVMFLDETFLGPNAPAPNRRACDAARAVLAALLPGAGTEIRSRVHTLSELMRIAGCEDRPEAFDELMELLDRRTRLLTPIAPDDAEEAATREPSYQLTHDYLVPSLREWLARQQKATRRGRAELRLADRASLWGARREARQLPSLREWATIRAFTDPRDWTPPERAVMEAADRHYRTSALRAGALLFLACALTWWIVQRTNHARRDDRAAVLVDSLISARPSQVPAILKRFGDDLALAVDRLRDVLEPDSGADDRARLHARLGLLTVDPSQAKPLGEAMLAADPEAFAVVCEALRPHAAGLKASLWRIVETSPPASGDRLRAAAALATYDPAAPAWEAHAARIVERLLAEPSLRAAAWVELLRPARERLLAALAAYLHDPRRGADAERALATSITVDYAAGHVATLAGLLPDLSSAAEFEVIFAPLRGRAVEAREALQAALDAPRLPEERGEAVERDARRRATAAIGLFRLGGADRVRPLLRAGPNPRVRALLIDRLTAWGASPEALLELASTESDPSARAALLLSLAPAPAPARADREAAASRVKGFFRDDPDPGVHAAARLLLTRWGRNADVAAVESRPDHGMGRRWYVDRGGATMLRLPGTPKLTVGSPDDEEHHRALEGRDDVSVAPFDLAMTELTVAQAAPFLSAQPYRKRAHPGGFNAGPEHPQALLSWFDAAALCNWWSEREGLPRDEWCYEPNKGGEYDEGMRLSPEFRSRSGYRLPTEAEWEYACRAGTTTARFFGETEALHASYAWFTVDERPRPVASILPSAFGLFDMYGNVSEWCQNLVGESAGDEDGLENPVERSGKRAVRGGGVGNYPGQFRSAIRFGDPPTTAFISSGVRLARSRPAEAKGNVAGR